MCTNQLSQIFQSSIPNSPAFSIGKRIHQYKQQQTPGPAAYSPKQQFRTSPKAIFSGSKDSFFKPNDSPGPGRYQDLNYHTQGVKFNKQKRCLTQENSGPGPGAYKTQQYFIIPTCIIPRQKYNTQHKDQFMQIGPGSYDIPIMLRTDMGFRIPKSQRQSKINNSPGPADYNVNRSSLQKGIKIGTSPRIEDKKIIGPGPAQYSPKYSSENSPRAVIGTASRESKKKDPSPGPGDYDVCSPRSLSFSFPKQQDKFKIEMTPFSYIQQYSSLKKTAMIFPKAQRNEKKSIVPGPGEYNIEGLFRKKRSDN